MRYLLLNILLFINLIVKSQFIVNASSGVNSFSYSTLKQSFDAINTGIHQGEIHILIGTAPNQTLIETIQPILNRSGFGAANYSKVYINPAFANITIIGSLGGACCVPTGIIHLNAANNIIIDGRINSSGAINDLTIENTDNSSSWASSIVLNGASNNAIRYCNIKSSSTGVSSGVATISFLYNSLNTIASQNNIIEYCNITKSGSNFPNTAIVSNSTSSTYKNINNLISNCNISDFKRYGIWLGSSSITTQDSGWIIRDNHFFQSSIISMDNNNYCNYGICVGYHDNGGTVFYAGTGTHQILNNTIGGDGNSGAWTVNSNAASAGLVVGGIFFAGGIENYSEISGNNINNFNIATFVSDQSSLSLSGFNGIYVYNSKIKIGTASGNKIHDIVLNHKYNSWSGIVSGIYLKSNADRSCEIKNNSIYNISAETGSGSFQYFYGIKNGGSSSVYTDQITNNIVTKINLKLNSNCWGIYGYGTIAQNHVSKIKIQNGTAELNGIQFGGAPTASLANYRVDNNEIILGIDSLGNATALSSNISGINLNSPSYAYYNSVLIMGTHTGSGNTACLKVNNGSGSGFVLANNLLYNARSGGLAIHYNIVSTGSNTITSSNNAYIFDEGVNPLGVWNNSTICSSLNNWVTTMGELNSISDSKSNKPLATFFRNATLNDKDDLFPSIESWLCHGASVSQLYDILHTQRNSTAPTTIGAYELQCNLLNSAGTIYVFTGNGNWNVASNWQYNKMPPSILPAGDIILIDPIVSGECLLNIAQTISPGATIQIMLGKKFRVPENLLIQ